ncbi:MULTISPECIES: ABC transporter ATP-binding protein [unclassified Bilifractor]|uniref:ABC transporter ATP-binding protein n=1 Tax=unclassified Bilifractor TaxID=2815795 RepID=UPI003F910DD3|nr:ATP-binding cassette domain-containing protein [Eubacterium sp.]
MKLELRDLYKSFGEHQVLKGISLTAESGTAVGLLGRNGAGKTTTIRILMNVFPADKGEILLDGKPIDHKSVKIGYLPEERGLYPKKIIADQLLYFAELKGMKRTDARAAIDSWLKRLGMSEYSNKRLDALSKGNQQKIQLVTALAHDPDILILDEPFSGLDPVNAELLKEVVRDEMKRGKIILFSSHQMNYIEEFCSEIAILNGGHIVLSGNLREIRHHMAGNELLVRSSMQEQILEYYGDRAVLTEDGAIRITLNDTSNCRREMQLLTTKWDVNEVRIFEPSLNDIFVQTTRDQI